MFQGAVCSSGSGDSQTRRALPKLSAFSDAQLARGGAERRERFSGRQLPAASAGSAPRRPALPEGFSLIAPKPVQAFAGSPNNRIWGFLQRNFRVSLVLSRGASEFEQTDPAPVCCL